MNNFIDNQGDEKTKIIKFEINLDEEENYDSYKEKLEKQIKAIDCKASDFEACIFTSGTSGKPKGVLMNHTNLYFGIVSLGHCMVPYHTNDKG